MNDNKKIPCVFGVLKTDKGIKIKEDILSYLNLYCNVFCVEQDPPGKMFEYPALKYTLKMAIDLNCPVLYLHTKGAVDPNHSWYQEYVRKLWKVEFGTDKIFESYNKIISETPKIICPIAGKDGRQTWWNGFIINPAAAKELSKTFHYDSNRYYYEEMCKYAPSIELISSAIDGCYNEKETNILLKKSWIIIMYNGYKVKVLIFAGRKDTMSILMPQIKSDYIDEIIIGVNTNNQEDLKFIYSLKDNESKITYLEVPNNIRKCSQESFRFFYTKMENEDTIYFKLDDDLIYIEPGYFEKTLKFRCEHPEYICVYPMIINNPLCNYLLNNDIPMKYKKDNSGEYMFATWKDPDVAEHLLRLFAKFKDEKDLWHIKNFEFGKEQNYHLPGGRIIRPSINAICFFGKDFKTLNVKNYPNDDEEFLTNQVFNCGKKSVIYGDTLVTHYAFFTQRNYLNSKNILELYK